MVKRISAREARERFAEVTDSVRYSGEPIVIEKQGQAFVAVISLEDLELLEALRVRHRQREFSSLAAKAAEAESDTPTDDEIVEAVKGTRQALYREWYGGA
jgi:prevent-host-death family protein